MREADPIHDAFGRCENTDPHGVPDRKTAIGTPLCRSQLRGSRAIRNTELDSGLQQGANSTLAP
jgi:hypothetical protein